MNNQNPNRWLNSPFHVSEPSGNNLVYIVDNSGVVVTEILPGATHGIRDTIPNKETKLGIANKIVESLNKALDKAGT